MPETYEARLIVNRHGDVFTAEWIESDGQRSEPFHFVLPLTAADASDLRWYLETYVQFPGAGDRKRAQGIERKLRGWGQALFDALFGPGESREVYRNLMAAAREQRRCLLTLGATDPDLLAQPWEMMRDQRGPLAFQGVTVRRQLRGAGPTPRFDLAPAAARAAHRQPAGRRRLHRPPGQHPGRARRAGRPAARPGDGRFLRAAHLPPPGGADFGGAQGRPALPPGPFQRPRRLPAPDRRRRALLRGRRGPHRPGARRAAGRPAGPPRRAPGPAGGLPRRRPVPAAGLWLGGPRPAGQRRGQRRRL